MTFSLTKPNNNTIYIFILLLSVSTPIIYIGTILPILILLFLFIKNPFRLIVATTLKPYIIGWSLIIFVHLIAFLFNFSYLNNLLWGLFTISSIILFPLIIPSNISYHNIINAFKGFLCFELIIVLIQILAIFISGGIEGFKNTSFGDSLSGTARNSSIINIIYSFIALIFFCDWIYLKQIHNSVPFFLLSSFLALITGFMASFALYIFSMIALFSLGEFFKIILKQHIKNSFFIFLLLIIIFLSITYNIFNSLYSYFLIVYTKFDASILPLKIIALQDTIYKFAFQNPIGAITGVGIGNYSSRAAFITSGLFLEHQSSFLIKSSSDFFLTYIKPLWEYRYNHEFIGLFHHGSIFNSPWCQFQTLFAEGGVISITIFIGIIIYSINNIRKRNNYWLLIPGMYLFLLLFLDNWFEYPCYTLLYWIMIYLINNTSYKQFYKRYEHVKYLK
jgi:hypothetical protein